MLEECIKNNSKSFFKQIRWAKLDGNFIRSVDDQNLRGVFREDNVRAKEYKYFFSILTHNEQDLESFTTSATFSSFSFFWGGDIFLVSKLSRKKKKKNHLSVAIWYLLQIL